MEKQDDHYYIEGYSAESDPYAMPNGVLVNKLGLTTTEHLNAIEAVLGNIKMGQILESDPPENFDAHYLRWIHHEIFSDVYPWAGNWRQVDIAKGETIFLPHAQIEDAIQTLLTQVDTWGLHVDMTNEDWSRQAAELLLRLNFIHPFREGNGRTQRIFLKKLAQSIGKDLSWAAVGNEAMRKACIDGVQGNIRSMTRLILVNTQ
jgi:cell filamentation protein